MDKYVLIVAGGKGLRMGGDLPKQFIPMRGKPLLMHTLEAFHRWDASARIILVLPEDHQPYWNMLCKEIGCKVPHAIVKGGDTRFFSVKNGLDWLLAERRRKGEEASGLDNLITASYDLLGLISFLTDGKKECRAWTIRKGTKAPQAAGKIHSDFERGFIRASVIGYGDLEANNFDYAAVKAKGLQRTEGKEYVVKDGDVIEFLFNV